MKSPTVLGEDGRTVRLGKRIGRGGEGEVYALSGSAGQAAKLYIVADLGEREAKIAAMVSAGLATGSDLVAFPIESLRAAPGSFAGFTMRLVAGHKPLFELYAPGARKAAFPHADYRFLVRTAANVARAVGAVHESGCVIGDINHSGLLVSDEATVALIDADSFQFKSGERLFPCRVGVPEYTPPELQGLKLAQIVRTIEHDRFGLAIVIFQLLFMGRHPFSGAYRSGEMPIERAIGEHRFAYSQRRKVGMTPPPAVPTLADFPAPVAAAFEAAFGVDGAAGRPSPRDWIALMTALEADLRQCAANPLHSYPKQAAECPWCRMERKQRISLFVAPGSKIAEAPLPDDPGAAAFDLKKAWARIEHEAPPPPAPADPPLDPLGAFPPGASRGPRLRRKLLGLVALIAAAAALLVAHVAWPIAVAGGALGLLLVLFDDPATRALARERQAVSRDWQNARDRWEDRAGGGSFAALRQDLAEARKRYAALPRAEADRIALHRRNRRSEQLTAYLATFYLEREHVPGVDAAVIAALTSYGIETAADINEWAVIAVPGIDRKQTWHVMAWRRRLEERFVYNTRMAPAEQAALDALHAELRRDAARLRQMLAGGPAALRRARVEAERHQTAVDPQLQALHRRRMELEAALRLW